MRVLDLFSGIGGFSLGLERAGMQTVAFCEIVPFCRRVLAKHWPSIPIHHDARTLKGSDVGAVDLICGGYPCQPFSLAGQRRGSEDDRHVWPEMSRLIEECRPTWVIGENVAGHVSMGLDVVLSDLETLNYTCRSFVIPAVASDAPHRRDRLWVVARAGSQQHKSHSATDGGQTAAQFFAAYASRREERRQSSGETGRAVSAVAGRDGVKGHVADTDSAGRKEQRRGIADGAEHEAVECGSRWAAEPDVGRVAYGVPLRVDRLRALGNAVVPQVAEMIGRAIIAAEREAV